MRSNLAINRDDEMLVLIVIVQSLKINMFVE